MADNLTVITCLRTFDMVLKRSMMRKEEGESEEALAGLSRTSPLAVLRDGRW